MELTVGLEKVEVKAAAENVKDHVCLVDGCPPDRVFTNKKGEERESCEKQSFDGHASKESKAMEWHPGCCNSCPDCSALFVFFSQSDATHNKQTK